MEHPSVESLMETQGKIAEKIPACPMDGCNGSWVRSRCVTRESSPGRTALIELTCSQGHSLRLYEEEANIDF